MNSFICFLCWTHVVNDYRMKPTDNKTLKLNVTLVLIFLLIHPWAGNIKLERHLYLQQRCKMLQRSMYLWSLCKEVHSPYNQAYFWSVHIDMFSPLIRTSRSQVTDTFITLKAEANFLLLGKVFMFDFAICSFLIRLIKTLRWIIFHNDITTKHKVNFTVMIL